MSTETQKNFKKQMKQIGKEMSNKNKGEYFSYIENDHVESYYSPKKRKRIIAISLGSIIPIIWTGYCIFTWVRPLLTGVNYNMPSISTKAISKNFLYESKHTDIVTYLDTVKTNENKINAYLDLLKHDFNIIFKDQNTRNTYIETNANLKKELENNIISLSSMEIPNEMEEYHATIKQKYETILEQTVYSLDIAKSVNVNNIPQLQFIIEKINLLQKQQFKQMTIAFDKVGIKYKQEGDTITYWYNK